MPTDKEVKKDFKAKASKDPDKYYATGVLKEEGFERKQCKTCNTYFWTTTKADVCGDPACSGGFRFINQTITKEELTYIDVWKKFSKFFDKRGYTPIPRYPVVARWRDDTDFVQASIYNFQPYVVSGEIKPPANPLVVPQFCLRFNDIDNVGITGAHYTGFIMIGQHAFVPPEEWDQPKYFKDLLAWFTKGLGIPNKELSLHEDAWAGGGNFGPCMEFFSRGLEIANQVYIIYEQTPSGPKELNLKVLDMGMGYERNAWFTKGTATSYETSFPTVTKKLYAATGVKVDKDLMKRFLPYSSYLNVDEVDDINKTWKFVADKVGVDVKELKEKILPLAGLYSVAEHSRSLLVAINDGALPSNVGGGYNLRVILRRALSFIDKYEWRLDLPDICEAHAKYLKPLFPELSENLNNVQKILDVEKAKFKATKQKTTQIISNLISQKKTKAIGKEKLIQLYDSNGISPELVAAEAKKQKVKVDVPENFYALVAERHEKQEQVATTKKEEKLDLKGVPETNARYFEDWEKTEFKANVLKIIDKFVILNETYFYPTSGGQLHDLGTIHGQPVANIFKQGPIIVHALEEKPKFKEGDEVKCTIDWNRRLQLAQHHTATHIINAAAKKVLGPHINQASARKTVEKAHIDLTHYQRVSEEEVEKIEKEANKIVKEKVNLNKSFMSKEEAEKKFGMYIYQGGVVPGQTVRIVEIPGIDVEACGGTHLNNTADAGKIRIIKTTKVSDGVIRIVFTAGSAAEQFEQQETEVAEKVAKILGVDNIKQVPTRAEELFSKWKKLKKIKKKGREFDPKEFELTSTEEYEGDVLAKTAEILKTQPEYVPKTVQRFLSELKEMKRS